MNIKERILATLDWDEPDKVPLTVYDWMVPRGEVGRHLRESGVGLVLRPPAHRIEHREVEIISREYWENGLKLVRKTIHTPVGDFSIKEARKSWPKKALWINFTSSMHIEKSEVIEAHTRHLLEEAGSKRGFAIGVTEDALFEDLERSLGVILRVLQDY